MAELVKVEPDLFAKYSLSPRTAEYHRAQIRQALGFRSATVADEQRWAAWLAKEQCPVEQDRGRLGAAVWQRCRSEGIEPPTEGQIERVISSALNRHEVVFAAVIVRELGPEACARLEVLLTVEGLLAEVKSDPGRLGLDTLLSEIAKLEAVRELELPDNLFSDRSDRLVAAWRSRAARMFPSDFLDCPEPVRYTLLAALCWVRQAEITDALIGLLVDLVHKINARAERRVEKELMGDLPMVPGKKGIFVRMVQAVLKHPDEQVRTAVWTGGARRGEDPAPAAEGADGGGWRAEASPGPSRSLPFRGLRQCLPGRAEPCQTTVHQQPLRLPTQRMCAPASDRQRPMVIETPNPVDKYRDTRRFPHARSVKTSLMSQDAPRAAGTGHR